MNPLSRKHKTRCSCLASCVALVLLAILIATDLDQARAQSDAPTASIDSRVFEARAKSDALSPREREAVKALFSNAFQLFKAGNFSAARFGFEDGIARDPGNAIARFYLAETLMRLKEPDEARIHYELASALAPSTTEGLQARAELAKLAVKARFFVSRQTLESHPDRQALAGTIREFVMKQAPESDRELAGLTIEIVDSLAPCEQCPSIAIGCPRGNPADPSRSLVSVAGGSPTTDAAVTRNLFLQTTSVIPYKTSGAAARSVRDGGSCVLVRRSQ